MIVKEKSNSMKRLKYLIAMPLAVVSMLLFTCNVSAGTYKETSSVVSNDTLPACSADSLRTVLHFGEIPVKESYAESDTVQIVRLDSEKLRLPEGFGWASAQTYQNGNVLIRMKATYENDKGDVLRLSSSVPWTAERLQSFIEEAKKGMLKSLNENYGEKQNKANKAASNASDSFVTSSATTTSRIVIETNDVEDFFDMYGKKEGGIGYNNQLILLDGKEITYQQFMQLAKEDIVETHIILPESTGLEKKFGPKAKNGIWVLVSKKNPNYWDEFKKQLAQE